MVSATLPPGEREHRLVIALLSIRRIVVTRRTACVRERQRHPHTARLYLCLHILLASSVLVFKQTQEKKRGLLVVLVYLIGSITQCTDSILILAMARVSRPPHCVTSGAISAPGTCE